MSAARYIVGDVHEVLATLPAASVDLILTSPPFLALRAYLPADHADKGKEMGSEATPGAYIDALLDVVEACRRVLAPHGSLVFELGDTYSGSGGAGGDYNANGLRDGQAKFDGSASRGRSGWHRLGQRAEQDDQPPNYRKDGTSTDSGSPGGGEGWPLPKSLCLIPELLRVAMVYGFNPLTGRPTERWRARNVVRWCRPNPPVGALGDKVRPATSDMLVACTSRTRYFDLDAVRTQPRTGAAGVDLGSGPGSTNSAWRGVTDGGGRERILSSHPAGAPPLDHWWHDEDTFDQDAWKVSTEPYGGSHYACVDADTEALTPNGWRRHDEMSDGDLIAAYDRARGLVTWQAADFHRYPFDGELVAIEKRETSQRLTPNHRVLYRTRDGVEHVGRADALLPSHVLPVAAPFDVRGSGPGVEMATLLGWYVTEGSALARTVAIYQSETANPKHVARIRDLLDAVGASYTERRRVRPIGASRSPREAVEVRFAIAGDVAAALLRMAPGKCLGADVLGWTDDECGALLDALVAGDGHTRASGRRAFIQRDRSTIDNVQALCCRLGLRSTIATRRDGVLSLTIGERSWLTLRGTNGRSDPVGRERYVGTVWCPSVPTTFWLARRNGRPFITGNTWPRALLVDHIKAMCPERVCRVCGEPSRRMVDVTYVEMPDRPLRDDESRRFGSIDGKRHNDHRATGHSTTGWTDCGHNDDRRGVVLDPFAGSGTTLAVATGHGRDAIGIDLDARNLDLARERVGMFLEADERPVETVATEAL